MLTALNQYERPNGHSTTQKDLSTLVLQLTETWAKGISANQNYTVRFQIFLETS